MNQSLLDKNKTLLDKNKLLIDKIRSQQKGHKNDPVFMIGEQLLEIAGSEPLSAQLIEKDLDVPEMSLSAAARHLQSYADSNHGKAKCFCITPSVADRLLREFYGLPIPEENAPEKKEADSGDLSAQTPDETVETPVENPERKTETGDLKPDGFIDLGDFL